MPNWLLLTGNNLLNLQSEANIEITRENMGKAIYILKNGLVIKYDWQVITVGAVIFSILYIFSLVLFILHYIYTYVKLTLNFRERILDKTFMVF